MVNDPLPPTRRQPSIRPAARYVPTLRDRVRTSTVSIAGALGWVLVVLTSLAATTVATWIASSLARTAQDTQASAASRLWTWSVPVFVTFGVPFLLATWKHHANGRDIGRTMMWMPAVWNLGGLLLASQLAPDLLGTALRSHGAWIVADHLGDSHSATRVMSALGHRAADAVSEVPRSKTFNAAAFTGSAEVALDKALAIPFTEEGTAILMDVTLQGPRASITLPYLFDTGASFTTVSSETANALGVVVPSDAPTLRFNTASGPRESRMVYLPLARFGDVRIPGLLVSVCDACVNERTAGLLGLNVMREFFVEMDYQGRRMNLIPRAPVERPNRAYDIEPVVQLHTEGSPEIWLGRVRWVVLVENRGTMPIENVVPVVKFNDGPSLLGRAIPRVEPRAIGRSLVEGSVGQNRDTHELGFTLSLAEAYW